MITIKSTWKVVVNNPNASEYYTDSIYNWSEKFDNLKEYFDDYVQDDIPIIIDNMNEDNLNVKKLEFELLKTGELLSKIEYFDENKVDANVIQETIDILTGQFSDGLGESLEQQEAVDITFENEYEDEETKEMYVEEESGSLSIKLWDLKDWDIKQV